MFGFFFKQFVYKIIYKKNSVEYARYYVENYLTIIYNFERNEYYTLLL